MKWQEEDKAFLLSAASEISAYLCSPVLEWNMSPSRFVLTPGRVLLSQRRLSSKVNDVQIAGLLRELDAILQNHTSSWQRKIAQEIPVRLRLWANVLEGYREEGLDASYSAQVVHRVMLKLLVDESSAVDTRLLGQLDSLDAALHTLLRKNGFIWGRELEKCFPEVDFWFLYCQL